MRQKKPPSRQDANHLVSHQLAKSNFFQTQQMNTGVAHGSRFLDVQPPKSLCAENLGDWERISTENVRQRIVFWLILILVFSQLLKFVAFFVILMVPSLGTTITVANIVSLVSDGLLVLMLKQMSIYYFPSSKPSK